MTNTEGQDHATEDSPHGCMRSSERLEEELAQVKRQLAATLERSGELIQRAVEAESAKKEFMSRISYDIRTPLNAVIGFGEILAQEKLTEEQRQHVDIIRRSAEQLLDLVVTSMADFFSVEVEKSPATTDVELRPPLDGHDAPGELNRAGAVSGTGSQDRFTGHVLVADDNQIDRMVARKLLEMWGLETTTVADGEEAVDAARRGSYDLIFMDMEMPCRNGYEATRELRSLGTETPIVALTARAMKTDRADCIAAGCDDYLAKPIARTGLLRMLEKYLTDERPMSEGASDQNIAEVCTETGTLKAKTSNAD